MLSVVVPCYNEQDNISNFAFELNKTLSTAGIDHEIVFVNDGSSDNSWNIMQRLASSSLNITAVNLSRNFGKEGAIFAGLEIAKGDCVAVMDSDFQHPIETLVEMYRLWQDGVQIVDGVKSDRGQESKAHNVMVKLFYDSLAKMSDMQLYNSSDFKLVDRAVVDALNQMPEKLTFFRGLSQWVGFRSEKIYFEVKERKAGKSKFSFKSLAKFAINSVTSFTSVPLHIVTVMSLVTFIFSIIMGVDTYINWVTHNAFVGFSTVIFLILIIGSGIMFSLGIIGHYLAKIYEEVKGRPRYIINEVVKSNNKQD